MKKYVLFNGRKIEYELTRKAVKNINLRIKKDGSISISAGKFVGDGEIERFIISNGEKILYYLDIYEKARAKDEARKSDKTKMFLLGKERKIKISDSNKNNVYLADNEIIIKKKAGADHQKLLEEFKIKLIKEIILDMCQEEYPDFSMYMKGFPTIKFRKMTSRNGSCQPKKNILTFNTDLVSVPIECIRFVVVHEFCHYIHPNHSKAFHDELDRRLKNNRELKKILDSGEFM